MLLSVKQKISINLSIFPMDFSLDNLLTFIQVCRERSFSEAAEVLHKSQSAVSTQIALLEDQAGLKFFDRSARPLRLTEAGNIFVRFAEEFIHKRDELDRVLAELATGTGGDVRIGATISIANYLLVPVVSEILKQHPKLKIKILARLRSHTYESVRHGEMDFAVVLADKVPADLLGHFISEAPLCFVASSKHNSLYRTPITLDQLRTIPFVMALETDQLSGYTETIMKILKEAGCSEPTVALQISDLEGIKEAVREGLGITLLPRYAVRREISEKIFTQVEVKKFSVSSRVMLIERPNHFTSPSVRSVKALVEAALRDLKAY